MVKIITIHSARSGTGKSMIVANVATLLAATGWRVGVIDANLQTGSMHCYFGLASASTRHTFNDYLLGLCDSSQAAYDVTPALLAHRAGKGSQAGGRVLLVPASTHPRDLERILREGYNIELLTDGLQALAQHLHLDVLLIDTHPGINEEMLLSLLSIAIADMIVIVLRLDQQDYQGTGVTVDVARTLGVPRVALIVNQIASMIDLTEARQQVARTYGCEVLATLPYSEALAIVGSTSIFALRAPDHPVTYMLRQLAIALAGLVTNAVEVTHDECYECD